MTDLVLTLIERDAERDHEGWGELACGIQDGKWYAGESHGHDSLAAALAAEMERTDAE